MHRLGIGIGLNIGGGAFGGGASSAAVITDLKAFAGDGCTYFWYGNAVAPTAAFNSGLNKTVIGWEAYVRSLREVHVKAYNHTSGLWERTNFVSNTTLTGDDHGVPAIEWDNDGYLWVFGRAHNTNEGVSRSNNVNDLEGGFTDQAVIAGKYAYPHPTNVGGLIYLFMRKDDTSVNSRYPLVLYVGTPTAGVMSWSSELVIGDLGADSRFYQGNHIKVGTDIYFPFTRANAADDYRQSLYCMVYDTLTGNVRNLDSSVTITPASFPILQATWAASFRLIDQQTFTRSGNIPGMARDQAGNLHFLYMDGVRASSVYSYYHVYWNGSVLSSPVKVGDNSPGIGDDSNRYNGVAIGPTSDGGVEMTFMTDSGLGNARGGNWSRVTRSSGGVFSSRVEILKMASASPVLDAPAVVRNANSDLTMLVGESIAVESGILRGFARGENLATPFIGTPYGPDVQAASVRFTTAASAATLTAMKTLIDWYRSSGAWQMRSLIYLPLSAAQDQALVNIRQSRFDLIVNGSPVFAANAGYTGVANGYFDCTIKGNAAATSTSVSCQVACKNNGTTQSLIGTSVATDFTHFWDGTTFTYRLGGSETGHGVAFAGSAGITGQSRTGTAVSAFGGGALLGTATATNVALSTSNFWINRRTTLYSTATFYAVTLGGYMSDALMIAEQAALKAYLNTITPGTIP